jgi:hypothetical protein
MDNNCKKPKLNQSLGGFLEARQAGGIFVALCLTALCFAAYIMLGFPFGWMRLLCVMQIFPFSYVVINLISHLRRPVLPARSGCNRPAG